MTVAAKLRIPLALTLGAAEIVRAGGMQKALASVPDLRAEIVLAALLAAADCGASSAEIRVQILAAANAIDHQFLTTN